MRNMRSAGRFPGLALLLGPLLFLLAAPAWPCTTNVNTGFQGQTILGNFIMEVLPTGSTVSVSPAAGVGFVNQRNPSGTRVFFDVVIDTNATPGGRTVICTFPSGATVTTPNGFTVLAQPTPTPTVTPTAPPPTPTPTPTGPPAPGGFEIAPDSIAEGTRNMRLIIAGSGFGPGTLVQTSNDILLERTTVLSPTRLEIFVSNDLGTPSGPRVFFVSTPAGPSGTVRVTVVPPDYLGAPASVTTAAVVFPRPGTIVGPGDSIYARGVIAASGTGPILGAWLLDDMPFDRFALNASGGLPLSIESQVPVPISFDGDHFLRLQIDQPQSIFSDPVLLVRAPSSASRLRLVEPLDGAVLRDAVPFRWTLVPGAQAYEVVFSPEEREIPLAPRFLVAGGMFQPSERQWRQIEKVPMLSDVPVLGRLFWSARPIFPGEVPGRAAKPNLLVLVTPTIIEPSENGSSDGSNGHAISWKGGSFGALYRVAFFGPEDRGHPVLTALTYRCQYEIPSSLAERLPAKLSYRVEALAPGGGTLSSSALFEISLEAPRPRGRLAPAARPAVLTAHTPLDGTEAQRRHPNISARWEGRVPPGDVLLLLDGTDVTAVARLARGSVHYTSLLPVEAGRHQVALRLGESVETWVFQTTSAPAPTVGTAQSPGRPADWRVELSGFVAVVDDEGRDQRETGHLAISSAASLACATAYLQETVDLAGHHDFDAPRRTVQDSRSWVVRAGGGRGKWRADALVGYSPPSSSSEAQLLSTGLARGGAELMLTTPFGRFGTYGTFDPKAGGQISSTSGPEQKIRGGTYDLPLPSDRFLLRGIYLDVEDEGNPRFGVPASNAKTYGGIGRWAPSPTFTLTLEGARSEFERVGAPPQEEADAFRLQSQGVLGRTGYILALHTTDAGFRNPANPALTPASQTNRRGGELGLSRRLGRALGTLHYRYLDGGITSGLPVPDAQGHSGAIAISVPFSPRFQAGLSGIFGLDRGDGGPGEIGPIPKLDRVQYGGQLTLSQTLRQLALAQSVSYVEFDDRVSSVNDLETLTANVTANGTLHPNFVLASSVAFNRVEGVLSGENDNLVIFAQPIWTLPALRVILAPRASYGRAESSISRAVQRSENYQALIYWSPFRRGRFETVLGLSGEWTRNRGGTGTAQTSGFNRRYAGTFAIRWGAGTAQGTAPPMPAPVTPQPAAPMRSAFTMAATPFDFATAGLGPGGF